MTTDEIKALLDKITPGKWRWVRISGNYASLLNDNGQDILTISTLGGVWLYSDSDAQFIAAAPTIVRDLLAEVERLQQALNQTSPSE